MTNGSPASPDPAREGGDQHEHPFTYGHGRMPLFMKIAWLLFLAFAANFFVAANDGIKLAFACQLGQVPGITLQCLVFFLWVGICNFLASANGNQNFQDAVFGNPLRLQEARDFVALGVGECDKQMFGADVIILEIVSLLLRIFQDSIEAGAHMKLALPLDPRKFRDGGAKIARNGLNVGTQLLQDGKNHPILLLDQRIEQVFGGYLRIAELLRMSLCRL